METVRGTESRTLRFSLTAGRSIESQDAPIEARSRLRSMASAAYRAELSRMAAFPTLDLDEVDCDSSPFDETWSDDLQTRNLSQTMQSVAVRANRASPTH